MTRWLALIGMAAVLSSCSGVQGHWHYVKDEHQPGPCLAWQDNQHKDRDGVYCRVYPTPVGSR